MKIHRRKKNQPLRGFPGAKHFDGGMLGADGLPEMSEYRIELCYGFSTEESGVYHSFLATDPEGPRYYGRIEERLAYLLSMEDGSDDRFSWDCMEIALPKSLVARIKADGVKEHYLERIKNRDAAGGAK